MGSPPIPDRDPPRGRSASPSSSSTRIPGRSPPRPHPGVRPAVAPLSVVFSPPKRRTGGSIKGKERALGDDPDEVGAEGESEFPPQTQPTYRHLLGQGNGGAANPLRVIAHIDAAMEMARLSIPEDQPMAVQQWNGLIAVNYPARAYGITRHETPAEALKKCPDLRLVHVQTYKNGETEPGYWDGAKPETHKVSLDMYRKESRKILEVFSEFCPVVEKASIDESYLDLTLPVRALLLERYPALANAPSGNLDEPLPAPASLGVTTEGIAWAELGNLVPVSGQKNNKLKRLDPAGAPVPSSSSPVKPAATSTDAPTPASPAAAIAVDDSPSPDPPEPPPSWSDLCLALGASIVSEVRAAVRARLGYTCSAGIAPNKMLAKLTSAWRKPNAQTVLRHCAVPAFLKPMGFQKIRNLGGKLGTAVKETYEAETVGDLLRFSLPELKTKLGDASGTWLWEIVRGLDYTEVDTKTQVKSMLSSKNFRPSIGKYGEVMHWLNILATELHLRLLDARDTSPGLWPKTITFTHRSPSFIIRSHQAPFPFTSSLSIAYILRAAEKLLRVALGPSASTAAAPVPESPVGPYSNIQLSFSGLERLEDGQRGIEGFFSAQQARAAASPVAAAERVKEEGACSAAGAKEKAPKRPRAREKRARDPTIELQADGTEALVLSSSSSPSPSPPPPRAAKRPRSLPTHTCARCKRVLAIPGEAERALAREGWGGEEVRRALEREMAEHADWHVARDLLESERRKNGWGVSGGGSGGGGDASSSSSSAGGASSKKGKGSSASTGKDKGKGKKGKKREKEADKGTLNGFFKRA
ncbi:N-acetyltransferase eso1 [Rhodotorula kratochvilovae]